MTATPDPWMSDTPSLLTKTLTHTAAATLVTAAGDEIPLDLVDARVTFDERSAPRVQVSNMTARVPTDAAQLVRIDPRTGCRIRLSAGYVRPGGVTDLHQLADLGVRTRSVARPDDQLTLTAHSDEALIIDAAEVVTGTLTGASTRAAIAAIIAQVLPAATVNATSATGPAISQSQVDTDRWDLMADLADRIGAKVYDDGSRTWQIVSAATLGSNALTVTHGVGGTLVDSDAEQGRDEWANWVVLRYIWTDGSNVRQRVIGSRRIQTGVYAAVTGNIKIYLEDRDTPVTQAEADAAAAALVARMVTRGRSLRISTISAYWLRPGDSITVQLPTGDPETHLVTAVTFDLRTGLMDVTTRLPDNTGTIGA